MLCERNGYDGCDQQRNTSQQNASTTNMSVGSYGTFASASASPSSHLHVVVTALRREPNDAGVDKQQQQQFHPESRHTPLWRKVFFALFDDHRQLVSDGKLLKHCDIWELRDEYKSDNALRNFQCFYNEHTRRSLARNN